MDTACIVITALGILVTLYSIVITKRYRDIKKQATMQVGGGDQQVQAQQVLDTAGNVTTINNYGTLNYNTDTKGTQNAGNN